MVELRILGPLEIAVDGTPVPLAGEKQRALVAILLLDVGRVVSTDRLIDGLWGAEPPRTAQTSLQNFVSQLRKHLGADVVVTKAPGYVLAVDAEAVDAARFERAVAKARDEADAAVRARLLAAALALWRGPPLPEFAYEAWAQPEIARLEELRLTAVEERIEADLESGRDAELVPELEHLVADHPLRERLRGQLMLALYRAGRQADALEQFQVARRTLLQELGIEPGPALQELHRAILRQEAPSPAAAAHVSADDHYEEVVRALLRGRLVLLLGADLVPIAAHLADRFAYPAENARELARVSQFVAITKGSGPLYDELHDLLDAEHDPTDVHDGIAVLTRTLRDRGGPQPLIVTTGYDLAVERALTSAGETFESVAYISTGRNRGKFCHVDAKAHPHVIDAPNTYTDLAFEDRPVILNLHGQVDRSPAREWESFVITEDDYIDYLAATDLANLVPVTLAAKLRRSHFLFLGYGLREWNLRVILNRIWRDQPVSYRSWAVQPGADAVDRAFWRSRDVDVLDVPLETYVQGLLARLSAVGASV
jgi:DNA-binding SARP family transcriptional activator